jgi:hypothetical protein
MVSSVMMMRASGKTGLVYPLKVRRLEQLDEVGLNVADFVCFPPNRLNLGEIRSFFKKYKSVSCRTFAADEDKAFKTPVKYEIRNLNELLTFAREQTQSYFVLINEALPLADSVIAGNLLFKSRSDFLLEYFRGPGTPRDIDSKPLTRVDTSHFPFITATGLGMLPDLVDRFPYRPVIFEFSLYPYPVGRRREKLIFWEWRKA